jgi:nifR3 family TIM-barrel protein
MISVNGLVRKSAKSLHYLNSSPLDKPLAVQLFGADPAMLAEGAKIAAGQGADAIDINMGCPVRKVVKTGAGASLHNKPQLVSHIVKAVRKAMILPLTVKIRSGWTLREINAVAMARIAEDCGADAIIVHPRTADQGFSGQADWEIIKAVKKAVAIPVIGNGDIHSASDAMQMIKDTGCDGVMIGRGALGNPWLMDEIISCLTGRKMPEPPSLLEKFTIIARHLGKEVEYYGEGNGSRNFRKHLLWYTKGLPEGARFRSMAGSLAEKETILSELSRFFRLTLSSGDRNRCS